MIFLYNFKDKKTCWVIVRILLVCELTKQERTECLSNATCKGQCHFISLGAKSVAVLVFIAFYSSPSLPMAQHLIYGNLIKVNG